jgi:hypothetical protein
VQDVQGRRKNGTPIEATAKGPSLVVWHLELQLQTLTVG